MGEVLYSGTSPYLVPSLYKNTQEDQRIREIFLEDKCRSDKTGSKRDFYEWCSNLTIGKTFFAECEAIFEGQVKCQHEFAVLNETSIKETETCWMGKPVVNVHILPIRPDVRAKIKEHCYDFFMGRPFPWWAIMLIILAIVIAFGIVASLFWKYWLKKRWQKPAQSTLESRWTESPVSSTSAVDSVARPPPLAPSVVPISNTTSQNYNINSGASITPSSSRSGSRRISQRSALSRSAGRGSTSGSRGRRPRSGQ